MTKQQCKDRANNYLDLAAESTNDADRQAWERLARYWIAKYRDR